MSKLWAIIEIVRALLGLWKEFREWQQAQKDKEAEEKRQKRDEAAGKLENAQTEKDFDNAQSEIVANKP